MESLNQPADTSRNLHQRIEHDFSYHPPSTDEIRFRHEQVRENLKGVAQVLVALTFPSREQSLMLTKLEEAMFWANASIARHQES